MSSLPQNVNNSTNNRREWKFSDLSAAQHRNYCQEISNIKAGMPECLSRFINFPWRVCCFSFQLIYGAIRRLWRRPQTAQPERFYAITWRMLWFRKRNQTLINGGKEGFRAHVNDEGLSCVGFNSLFYSANDSAAQALNDSCFSFRHLQFKLKRKSHKAQTNNGNKFYGSFASLKTIFVCGRLISREILGNEKKMISLIIAA